MFIGETVNDGAQTRCFECNQELHPQILSSPAGYYIGFACPADGPHSRESEYYQYAGLKALWDANPSLTNAGIRWRS